MGFKAWRSLSVLLLTGAALAGCNNGPEKNRSVQGVGSNSPFANKPLANNTQIQQGTGFPVAPGGNIGQNIQPKPFTPTGSNLSSQSNQNQSFTPPSNPYGNNSTISPPSNPSLLTSSPKVITPVSPPSVPEPAFPSSGFGTSRDTAAPIAAPNGSFPPVQLPTR